MLKKPFPRYCMERALMSLKNLPQHSIQRTFLRWFNEYRKCFYVSLSLSKITAEAIELKFNNFPDCFVVRVTSDELAVHVYWEGEWWDMIIDLDAWIYPTHAGYKCRCCYDDENKNESFPTFPTEAALWLDHLFDPFLTWVNEKLAPARWLQISCTNDRGARWETLIRNNSELSKPDHTMLFLTQLKRIDGTPCYEGGHEGITNWLIQLTP